MRITEEQKRIIKEIAEKNFTEKKRNCCESILDAFLTANVIDLEPRTVGIGYAFEGGPGGSGYTCGAVYAGLMVLGAAYGRKDPLSWGKAKTDRLEDDYRYYMMRRFNNLINDFVVFAKTWKCKGVLKSCGGLGTDECDQRCKELVNYAVDQTIKYLELSDEENKKLPYKHNIYGWK